jgi:hypothetical protein
MLTLLPPLADFPANSCLRRGSAVTSRTTVFGAALARSSALLTAARLGRGEVPDFLRPVALNSADNLTVWRVWQ